MIIQHKIRAHTTLQSLHLCSLPPTPLLMAPAEAVLWTECLTATQTSFSSMLSSRRGLFVSTVAVAACCGTTVFSNSSSLPRRIRQHRKYMRTTGKIGSVHSNKQAILVFDIGCSTNMFHPVHPSDKHSMQQVKAEQRHELSRNSAKYFPKI